MAPKRYRSKERQYKIIKWARADVPCEHEHATHREALDLQRDLTKREGAQNPEFLYTIEESS
jgi:hypothetical protein